MKGLLPLHAEDLPAPVRGDALGGSSAVTVGKDWSEQGTSQRGSRWAAPPGKGYLP